MEGKAGGGPGLLSRRAAWRVGPTRGGGAFGLGLRVGQEFSMLQNILRIGPRHTANVFMFEAVHRRIGLLFCQTELYYFRQKNITIKIMSGKLV